MSHLVSDAEMKDCNHCNQRAVTICRNIECGNSPYFCSSCFTRLHNNEEKKQHYHLKLTNVNRSNSECVTRNFLPTEDGRNVSETI